MDLSHWGITTDDIVELKIPNTFGRKFVIDGKYLLKETDDTHGRQVEASAMRILSDKGIGVPEIIGDSYSLAGKRLTLFKLHKQVMELDSGTLFKVAKGIASVSQLDRNHFADQKIRSERLKESMVDVSRIIKLRSDPETMAVFEKAILSLDKDLIPFLRYFNTTVSHGDMHPDNLLQDNGRIIIADWETIAIREELYDLAAFLGCLGIVNPTDLLEDKTKILISSYVQAAKPTKLAFSLLPELVIASRLNWLCKWLILNNDKEIIGMERELISMLVENKEKLRSLWLRYAGTDFRYSKHKWFLQDAAMLDEVSKAMERLKGDYQDLDLKATDLRLSTIFYGQNDDILGVLRSLESLRALAKDSSHHILAEFSVALGNSCLDLSKFGLIDALHNNIAELKSMAKDDDMKIGYAFSLRNTSIALAETGDLESGLKLVDELKNLADSTEELEIKGEYARALSNAITSMLSAGSKERIDDYRNRLEELYMRHKDHYKVSAAYKIAMANLSKPSAAK